MHRMVRMRTSIAINIAIVYQCQALTAIFGNGIFWQNNNGNIPYYDQYRAAMRPRLSCTWCWQARKKL
jgi:hypothetical protein